ncbi:MAG: hypothetical protein RLZZ175_2243 [Bacteroidota bacterium]|jgi:outer membrane protein TolC
MKKLIILIFMAFAIKVSAQRVDYTKIIAPYDSIPVVVYIEKLVSVAWENYPKNHSFISKKNEAIENVKQARNSWMNNLNLFTSFNSYNNSESQNFTIVPNLGLGLSLNVGSIYSLPGKIKIAKEELKIADNEINAQKLYIRSQVISRFNDVMLNMDLLKLQTEAVVELKMTVTAVKEKFLKGEISIEEYNKVYVAYTVAKERAITSESNYRTSKAYLEELLGVNLEQIL